MLVIVEDGNTDLHVGLFRRRERRQDAVSAAGLQRRRDHGADGAGRETAGSEASFGERTRAHGSTRSCPPERAEPERSAPSLKVRRAGILDDILFFVTTDPTGLDPTGIHPFLAQGVRRGNRFDVTRLADDVEDMQVAYGIDSQRRFYNALTVLPPVAPAVNIDPNVSTAAGGDEWRPNVTTEGVPGSILTSSRSPPFVAGHTGIPVARCTARACTA